MDSRSLVALTQRIGERRYGIVPRRSLLQNDVPADDETLEVMLDQSLREGRTSIPRLRNRLEQLGRPGRPGVASIKRLLSDRDPAAALTESFLETRCNRLFRRAGLPRVQPQRVVYDEGGYVGRIDFDYPDDDLVIEAHSYKYHSSRRAFERDVDRWNRLRAIGKRLVLITWRDALDRPDEVVADIRRELAKPTGLFGHHHSP